MVLGILALEYRLVLLCKVRIRQQDVEVVLDVCNLVVVYLIGYRELSQILIQGVILHARLHHLLVILLQYWWWICSIHIIVLRQVKNGLVHLNKVRQRINGSSLSLLHLKKLFTTRILPVMRILLGSSPSTPTRRQRHNLPIGAPAMFLLDVRVECWIRQILLVTVLAVEVSAPVIILGPPLARHLDTIGDTARRVACLRVEGII